MTTYKSPADFPLLKDLRFFIGDGQDVAIVVDTTDHSLHLRVQTGQIGMLISKLFEVGAAARKRLEARGLANIPNDFVPMSAMKDAKISVATSVGESGRGMIGIVHEIGGVPFTGALSPEDALALAEKLRDAVEDQPAHTRKKPS